MQRLSKIAYAVVFGIILYPLISQWDAPIELKQKQALLPPKTPTYVQLDNSQLSILLARNLWDKKRDHKTPADVQVDNSQLSILSDTKRDHIKSAKDGEVPSQQEWILQGIGRQAGEKPIAVIMINGKTQSYNEGGTLPDGAQLITIGMSSIVVEKTGKKKDVYLFKTN
jgi:hypothetical protein